MSRCTAALLSVRGPDRVATAGAAHADLTFDQQMLTLSTRTGPPTAWGRRRR
jgi:hypothetical protein